MNRAILLAVVVCLCAPAFAHASMFTPTASSTIEENLAFMIGQKFYAGKKAEIAALLSKAQVLRHEFAAVVTGRFIIYEQAQLKKLAASGE